MLAAFDRFEKERFAGSTDFSISRQRGFDVREQTASDWNEVSLGSEFDEFGERWRIHAGEKIQASSAKIQGSSKIQIPISRDTSFGAWDLELR